MRIQRSIVLVAVGVIAGATIVGGIAVGLTAGASGPGTTYFACLKSGRLTHVGTTPPTCTGAATQISWNSIGPQGPAGPGAQSASAPFSPSMDGDVATVTLTLSSGDYLVTWDVSVPPSAGGCSFSGGTNVTVLTAANESALVSVGTGGWNSGRGLQ
jgi:hypothetical protein